MAIMKTVQQNFLIEITRIQKLGEQLFVDTKMEYNAHFGTYLYI